VLSTNTPFHQLVLPVLSRRQLQLIDASSGYERITLCILSMGRSGGHVFVTILGRGELDLTTQCFATGEFKIAVFV